MNSKIALLASAPIILVAGAIVLSGLAAVAFTRIPAYPNSSLVSGSPPQFEFTPSNHCGNCRVGIAALRFASEFRTPDGASQVQQWFRRHRWSEFGRGGIFMNWLIYVGNGRIDCGVGVDARKGGQLMFDYFLSVYW
jgi:hypothetical protein